MHVWVGCDRVRCSRERQWCVPRVYRELIEGNAERGLEGRHVHQ